MAWTTPKTWSVAEKVTAALMNTHLRDNLLYIFATASFLTGRQGGSSTAWNTTGTTNQSVAGATFQVGAINIPVPSGSTSASVTLTYPVAWTQQPMLFLSSMDPVGVLAFAVLTGTPLTTITITATRQVGASTASTLAVAVNWLAIGSG